MAAQILAICIFIGMFLMIGDVYKRQILLW